MPDRPSKTLNSYENLRWWLEKYFSPVKFEVKNSRNVDVATQTVVNYIDHGFPVMVSTNHDRTDGHIILVVGYESYDPCLSDPSVRFVCHDLYGKLS